MATGDFRPCYASPIVLNLFKNIDKPLRFYSVGHHCRSPFCMNSSHFISFGTIPEYKAPTYYELRNRSVIGGGNWINEDMKNIMSQKLYDNHRRDTMYDIIKSSCMHYVCLVGYRFRAIIPKSLKSKLKNVLHK